MIQYEVFTAGCKHKIAGERYKEQVAVGMACREGFSRPEVRGVVKETRQSWNGLLRGMREDDQLQIKWEKGLRLHAEDAKHKASLRTVKSNQVRAFCICLAGKRWYCERGHLST